MAYVLSSIFRFKKTPSANADDQPPPILLKFATPFLKQSFFNQYMKFKDLKLSDIGIKSSDRIYFCDNLTKKNSSLYKKAADMKATKQIEKIQVRNGFVRVMFTGSNVFKRIITENDLYVDIQSTSSHPPVDLNNTIVERE